MNIKNLFKSKKFIYIGALVFIVLFSVAYSALEAVLGITGNARYNKKYPVRVTNIVLQGTANSGLEQFNPNYTWNTTTTGVNLPNLNSTVTYTVTVRNYGSEDKGINLNITNNSNSNMTYETSNMPTNNIIPANSTVSFNITIKYNTSTLPGTTTDTMTITYTFGNIGAMFQTGQEVNAKMKQFVNSSATYSSQDTTITNIARYTGTPDPNYLIEANKVSTDEYITPIYMWYDSTNTTIYWYSEADFVYYNQDSSYFYGYLRSIDYITNLNDINSSHTTNMAFMFNETGYNSQVFTLSFNSNFDTSNVTNMDSLFEDAGFNTPVYTLSLGPNFDTSNVTNMRDLFNCAGRSSTVFTLDLGDKFDTSKVTDMFALFKNTGYSNTSFTLDLGDKFDTSSVTNMSIMFSYTGYSSTVFTLDLGDYFDTSNVTDMSIMFRFTGYSSPVFTLDLGDKFDTSNVTDMSSMFYSTGYSSTSFTLDLGDKFDTSSVTNMYYMFNGTGYSSTVFTLDLGDYFDTSNVTDMSFMFRYTGYTNTSFTLDLGDHFNTSNVTAMEGMFGYTGYNSTVFTLDLGDYFDTSKVTNMSFMFTATGYSNTSFTFDLGPNFDTSSAITLKNMFNGLGYNSTVLTLDLGDKFDTSNVTDMENLFYNTGTNSTVFTLDLGPNFDTSNVTTMLNMFGGIGYNSTVFTLDLGDKFDTSNVTTMEGMFYKAGFSSPLFVELDLGGLFDTSKVTNMKTMFNRLTYVNTIYVPSTFTTANVTESTNMFANNSHLVGDKGTAYVFGRATDKTYGHIDGGLSNPGYLSSREPINAAVFKPGKLVNARIKQFVTANATYNTEDTTITNITRFNGVPANMYLVDENIVSTINSTYPIYMWYDSSNTTVYWYTESTDIYYAPNSEYLFSKLEQIDEINGFDGVKTDYLANSSYMFSLTGYYSTSYTINLGSHFDTSKVVNMAYMFNYAGYNNLSFTLDLGPYFDTGNVTNMTYMFRYAGYKNTSFTLDLGDNFDTSNVTNMAYMFYSTGSSSSSFYLNLGDKFNTSNVTTMERMFVHIGYNTSGLQLDLGPLFNTSKVTNMDYMFNNNPRLKAIYVPNTFVTTAVTSSSAMFTTCTRLVGEEGTIYNSSHVTAEYAHIDGGTSNPGYLSSRDIAIFTTGKNMNTKMKRFISPGAIYGTKDETITGFARFTGTPDLNNLTSDNIASSIYSPNPIYVWYDENSTTIYWYTEVNKVFFHSDSSYFFENLEKLGSISNLNDISAKKVVNMSRMFMGTGEINSSFTLTLGSNFDTSNVTDMSYMFRDTGSSNTTFVLDLGPNFDTSKVTNMSNMFCNMGDSSTLYPLIMGDKFDTSNVTNMESMFDSFGYKNQNATIDFGNHFDTSNVTNMEGMFSYVGYKSNSVSLTIPSSFVVSNVTNMNAMFSLIGHDATSCTINLGSNFDTSSVTDMSHMFGYTGYSSTDFTLDLGTKFDTSNVTNMTNMFSRAGYSSTVFTLDLGNKFYTSNVTKMDGMFFCTGHSSPIFTLALGDHFDTSNVTNMNYMFYELGNMNPSFTSFSLGPNFDTSNVTSMYQMFYGLRFIRTIYAPSTFVTTSVTNSIDMFKYSTNIIGGEGTTFDSNYVDKTYAHIDGGTSNPGYFTAIGAKTATIYYNTNTSSGSITVATAKTSCVPASGSSSCTITVPSEVSSSMGKYNSPYKGLSASTGSMSDTLTISADTTLYATYSKQVTNYYYNGSSQTNRIIYRNEFFTSTSAMESRLATGNGSTTNYSASTGPGSSVWTGLSTGNDTTPEYTTVQDAANSNTANLYTVYTYNINYSKGSNVSSIGATTGSCKVTTATSCNVTLPSITPNSGYISVGWNTTNGATTGTSAGSSYTLSSSGTTLYANAKANTETITFGSCSQGPGRLQQCYVEKNVSTIKNPSSIAFTWTNATITQGGQAGDLVVYAQYYNGSSWQDFSLVGGGNYYYGKGKYVGDGVFTYTGTINAASVPSNIQKIRLGVYSNATAYPSLTVSMGSGKVVLTG